MAVHCAQDAEGLSRRQQAQVDGRSTSSVIATRARCNPANLTSRVQVHGIWRSPGHARVTDAIEARTCRDMPAACVPHRRWLLHDAQPGAARDPVRPSQVPLTPRDAAGICGRKWRGGEAATRRSAKPLCEGSSPSRASTLHDAAAGARDVSLLKILILSSVLDPFVSLEELHDACRTVDEIERDRERQRRGRQPVRRQDPRDAHVRGVIAAFWN